jgi:hypothetical protein
MPNDQPQPPHRAAPKATKVEKNEYVQTKTDAGMDQAIVIADGVKWVGEKLDKKENANAVDTLVGAGSGFVNQIGSTMVVDVAMSAIGLTGAILKVRIQDHALNLSSHFFFPCTMPYKNA